MRKHNNLLNIRGLLQCVHNTMTFEQEKQCYMIPTFIEIVYSSLNVSSWLFLGVI